MGFALYQPESPDFYRVALCQFYRRKISAVFSTETTATINYLFHHTRLFARLHQYFGGNNVAQTGLNGAGSTSRFRYRCEGQAPLLVPATPQGIEKFIATHGHEKALIFFKDSEKPPEVIDATLEGIEGFVSARSKLKVASEVDHVEIYLESRFLEQGVVLIDTPGLNGLRDGHTQMTESEIQKSHLCTFLFSAEQPGAKTNFEILTDLKSKECRITLVLNKIDGIKSNEQRPQEVVTILKESYHTMFPQEALPKLWPLAAYPALVARSKRDDLDYHKRTDYTEAEKQQILQTSKIEEFEERLWKFLTQGEKTREELLSPVDRVKNTLVERKRSLAEKLAVLIEESDSTEISAQIKELEEEIRQSQARLLEDSDISTHVRDLLTEVEEKLATDAQRIRDTYRTSLTMLDAQDDSQQITEFAGH